MHLVRHFGSFFGTKNLLRTSIVFLFVLCFFFGHTKPIIAQCINQSNVSWVSWSAVTSGTIFPPSTPGGVGVSVVGPGGNTFTPTFFSLGTFNLAPVNLPPDGPNVLSTDWFNTTTTFNFSEPVVNPIFLLNSIGSAGIPITLNFPTPYTVIFDGGGTIFSTPTSLTGSEGNVIIEFPGTFNSINFSGIGSEHYANVSIGIRETAACVPTSTPSLTPTVSPTLFLTSTPTITPTPTPNFLLDDPTIFKASSNGAPFGGQPVTFTLSATNPATSPNAVNVIVTDPVPSQFTVQSATTSQGGFTITGQLVTFNIGALAPGQTVTMTVSTVVNNIAAPISVANIATLDADQAGQPHITTTSTVTESIQVGTPGTGVSGPPDTSCKDVEPGTLQLPYIFKVDPICRGSSAQARVYIHPGSDPYTGFTIAYGPNLGSEDHSVSFGYNHAPTQVDYTINDLDPNQRYYFKVRANNGCRSGEFTTPVQFSCKKGYVLPQTGVGNLQAIMTALGLASGSIGIYLFSQKQKRRKLIGVIKKI